MSPSTRPVGYIEYTLPDGRKPDELRGHLDAVKVKDFVKQQQKAIPWLIEPYLPAGGVVFLHGPTSAGKSPLTWKIANAVAGGEDFFGYKTQTTGPVLYIELDTPGDLIRPRLLKLEAIAEEFYLATFDKPLNTIDLAPEDAERLARLRMLNPKLVIVNTLRKAHAADDKESHVPSLVYGKWQEMYPGATILFVHHDKKSPKAGDDYDPNDSFSGNKAWANDAQVVLKLIKLGDHFGGDDENGGEEEYKKTKVSLRMTKSQVSDCELYPPLHLQLDTDGTNWLETGPTAYRKFFSGLSLKLDRGERIKQTMQKFGMGRSAIYNAVKGLE
jgi:RecA-family ATPase